MTALVALDDVSRIYRRRSRTGSRAVTALDGVTLRIGSGECVAVMGASGSGKSTLLAVLGALDTPTSGTYRLEGTDIGRLDDVRLARLRNRRLGFVFQAFHLLPRLSAAENVELPLRYGGGPGRLERAALVATALASVGLTHRADHRPAELSGGQQQRVAIARALINDPALILADEPTGNLDPSNAASVLDLLAGLPEQGRTLVVVTHDPAIAARAGRVLRLEGGRLASDEGRLTLASAGLGR